MTPRAPGARGDAAGTAPAPWHRAPGSLPWLLRHESRLAWRELTATTSAGTLILAGVVTVLLVHVALWFAVRGFRGIVVAPLPPGAVFAAVALIVVAFPIMVALAVNRSVVAVFERGDMDLLASSPLDGRVIFASRVLGLALYVFLAAGLFLLPLGSVGVMLGLPQLLGIYPLLAGLALTAASLGMMLTLLLVRLMGARRARTFAQVLGAVLGAVLFLLSQLPNLLGVRLDAEVTVRAVVPLLKLFRSGGPLGAESLVWYPARALYFEPLPVLVVLLGGAGFVWLGTAALHRAFMSGAQEAVTAPSRRPRRERPLRFRQGAARVVLTKEWRALLRDPYLLSQTLLQLLYLVPLGVILFTGGERPAFMGQLEPLLAGSIVLLSGTLAASLAQICFTGEEAADLLRAAPIPEERLLRLKLLAALLPAWLLAAPPIVGLTLTAPGPGLAALLAVLAVTLAVGLIRRWNPLRTSRADLFKPRRQNGDTVMGLLEGFTPPAWAVAAGAIAAGLWWGWVAALVGVAMFAAARARGRALDRSAS